MRKLKESINYNKFSLKVKLGFFKRYFLQENFRRKARYSHYFNKLKIDDNVIFYESSNSKRINGNPYALFKFLVNNPDYKNYLHVWSTSNLENEIVKKYSSHKKVKFVLYHSKQYLKYLTSAKYLINDSTFPYYFIRKKDQIYANIWHGTPLKFMGKDASASLGANRNVQRNFLHASYFINSNKYTAEILLKSNDIYNLFEGHIANIGYPAVDFIFKTDKQKLRDLLKIDDDETVILYAPTWRGDSPSAVVDTINEMIDHISRVKKELPPKFRLFVKLHSYTMKFAGSELKEIAIPEHLEINEMLSITDVLITDYSSVFFEFLSTNRPIIFFCYDKYEYVKERGIYIPLEELPGPICESPEDVVDALNNLDILKNRYKKVYNNFIKKFASNDDGNASKRAADLIFNNNANNIFSEKEVYKIENKRKKILLSSGPLSDDEITVDLINLVNTLDKQIYDVYLFIDNLSEDSTQENINKLSKDVKLLFKVGGFSYSFHDYVNHVRVLEKGVIDKDIPKNLYLNESKRLFGSSVFNAVFDLRGESKSSLLLFAFGHFQRKYIYSRYLCNEGVSRSTKKALSKKDIKKMFYLYKFFDKIFFTYINQDSIDKYMLNEFKNLKNKSQCLNIPVDYKNILILASKETQIFENKKYQFENYEISDKKINISGIALPDKKYVNFIFAGKLSYNEGVSKLINAFIKLNEKHSNIRLYIVGDGPIDSYIENRVLKLGIKDKVILINSIDNPFWILNMCDCIISPSSNIDQNTSIIEYLVLGKPIIATITPNLEILNDYVILVDNSDDGLFKGMLMYIEDGFNQKYFDFKDYNHKALENFYNEVFKDN